MKSNALRTMIGIGCCALAVALAGCSSTPTRESTGEYIDDSTITAKVKASYAKDPQVSMLEVGVETYKGVVQLSGFVDNDQMKQRAGDLAKRVRGVVKVDNNIVMKPLGPGDKNAAAQSTNSASQYSGEVTTIDTTNNVITVRKALISHDFHYASSFDANGVHVGDQVNVTYESGNGVNNVIRVDQTSTNNTSSSSSQ